MIADLIKENTHAQHQSLEALMIRQIKAIKDAGDYIELLKIFYSYFGGLETRIDATIGGVLPDKAQRRKSEALAADIAYFGGRVPVKASDDDLPVICNERQGMAALYVIEGSTLGGIYISRMIQKRLDLKNTNGLSFFEGYGEQTQTMWERFKTVLNAMPQNRNEELEMIGTANETFLKFQEWMEKKQDNL